MAGSVAGVFLVAMARSDVSALVAHGCGEREGEVDAGLARM